MHARDHYAKSKTTFSFEFFPPKTEKAAQTLFENIRELDELKPSFVSVTYGAGGTTRSITQDLVARIRTEIGFSVMPHLTCVCHTEAEIYDILERYAATGISNILCLGGDPPRDKPGYDRSRDAFLRAADLVRYVRKFSDKEGGRSISDPRGFGIGVAGFPEGHPGTPNRLQEMDYLKMKVDEGADFIITQLFFDNHDFYDFRDRCELAGIDVPIVAGIMPISSATGMRRMGDLAAGARFPASLLRAVQRATDGFGIDTPEGKEAVKRVGIHWATEQCRDLLDHDVRGLHFYTLNKSTATREIYANLGVRDSVMLAQKP